MLDKTIPYHDILMHRRAGKPLPAWTLPTQPLGAQPLSAQPLSAQPLPRGYHFSFFRMGDELAWADIETSVGEFDSCEEACVYFQETYLPYRKEVERRCLFLQAPDGRKIGTMTIWWNYTGQRRDPWIHWVALRPEHQGKGLGKALVAEGLRLATAIEGDRDFYLHTQTWSYKAIGIYMQAGFERTREHGLAGYDNAAYDKATEVLRLVLRST